MATRTAPRRRRGRLGRTVVVFGAGATKACGGPLTNEILPDALALKRRLERAGYIALVERFLGQNFNLPPPSKRRPAHFPPLPLVLSLVDTALDRGDALGRAWPPDRLRKVRDGLEYLVFALLEHRLRSIGPHYRLFLDGLYAAEPESVTIVSLNYDIIADNTLARLGARQQALPDYRCDIATPAYREAPRFGCLLKVHGSLNWLYCPNCHRLDLGVAPSGRTVKVRGRLYDLDSEYGRRGSPCIECETLLRPVLITPTHLKDYRNPHIARVWYEAARALREAERAIFVGYSMPDDDVEVIYLFKRGLAHLDPSAITVVEYGGERPVPLEKHPVGLRYRALFGNGLDWHPTGFEAWINAAGRAGYVPGAC
jgi:hypothetical protein